MVKLIPFARFMQRYRCKTLNTKYKNKREEAKIVIICRSVIDYVENPKESIDK